MKRTGSAHLVRSTSAVFSPPGPIHGGMKTLLVIDSVASNWPDLFRGHTLASGEQLDVYCAPFVDLEVISYGDSHLVVTIGYPQTRTTKTIVPDFILFRSTVHGIATHENTTNFMAIMHSGIPCLNSAHSVWMCMQRPIVAGALHSIARRCGPDQFPTLPQVFMADPAHLHPGTVPYPMPQPSESDGTAERHGKTWLPFGMDEQPPAAESTETRGDVTTTAAPPEVFEICVRRTWCCCHSHAGYGKVKLDDPTHFADARGLCGGELRGEYALVEPFIDWDFDLRIQKIGSHYRCFQRRTPTGRGSIFMTRTGWQHLTCGYSPPPPSCPIRNTSIRTQVEDVPLRPEWGRWVDECSRLFGGMDLCALDVLHRRSDDRYFILELNDSGIGLTHRPEEDLPLVRDLVLERMSALFPTPPAPAPDESTPGATSTSPGAHPPPPPRRRSGMPKTASGPDDRHPPEVTEASPAGEVSIAGYRWATAGVVILVSALMFLVRSSGRTSRCGRDNPSSNLGAPNFFLYI
ncbi:putative synapsin Ia [Paratrimastix pyriformis]|uniref:Synapsin Ia n=1 Tax=Paratrimastix pyriformis TaxID=342808 RepID=A0ABQ8U993_9EUKA|nr:putative synapsin Ia [Paratrimastix pyriformis]